MLAQVRALRIDLDGVLYAVGDEELVTPAALAVAHCARHELRRAALAMNEEVKRDFAALEETDDAQAVIVCATGRQAYVVSSQGAGSPPATGRTTDERN